MANEAFDFAQPAAAETPDSQTGVKTKATSRNLWIGGAIAGGLLACTLCTGGLGILVAVAWNQARPGADGKGKGDDKNVKLIPAYGIKSHELIPGRPVVINGVKVEITSGAIFRGFDDGTGQKFFLYTKISNNTATEVITFTRWHYALFAKTRLNAFDTNFTIRDEFGNAYNVHAEPINLFLKTRVDPGGSTIDDITFEPPQAAAKEIIIVLQGSNIGRPGHTITMRLPRSFFKLPAP